MSAAPAFDSGTTVRLAAFAGLAAVAASRYAAIEARPPALRVIAMTVTAVGAGAALTVIRAPAGAPSSAQRRAVIGRAISVVAVLVIMLMVAGIPARLLAPSGWGRFARDAHRGLGNVASTLWPYTGGSTWTRLDILLALAVVPLAAAVLGFWPTGQNAVAAELRQRARGVAALGLLLALYVTGVIDSNDGSATIEGLALLLLLVGWLWLPGLPRGRALAAAGWLAVAGGLAAVLTAGTAGGQGWFNYRGWDLFGSGTAGTSFSWDQTYGPIGWSRSTRTMFTVSSQAPGLWKVTTLDRFDGLRFVRSDSAPAGGEDLPLPLDDHWYQFARFTVRGLSSAQLPAEQGVTTAVTFGRPLRYEEDGTVQTAGPRLRSGETYTVMSYVPRPTAAELRAAPRTFPRVYLRYTDFDLPAPGQSGLRLAGDKSRPGPFFTARTVGAPAPGVAPAASSGLQRRILASPYGSVYRLARRLAARARTPYDTAQAIDSYLKANYAYNEHVPARRYPLESFLVADRAGYCQQFSGAMALMLRMDGIPARVAAGFLTGSHNGGSRSYRVSALDAHAWVEVFFSGIGWVAFNPTPARYTGPIARGPVFASQTTASPLDAIAATVGSPPQSARQDIGMVQRQRTGAFSTGLLALYAIASALALAVLAGAVRWCIGAARLRRSLAGDGELATVELVLALRRLGYAVPATVTLAEIERLVRARGGPEAARYVQLLRERRFAGAADRPATLGERRRLRRALTAPLGLDERLRGHWALPPGTAAWGAAASADHPGGP